VNEECSLSYTLVYIPGNLVGDSRRLTRYPLITTELRTLYGNVRNVPHARLDHPTGPIDDRHAAAYPTAIARRIATWS